MTEILPILWGLFAASFVMVPPRLSGAARVAAGAGGVALTKPIATIGRALLSLVGRATMRAPPAADPLVCGTGIVLGVSGWLAGGPLVATVFGGAAFGLAAMRKRATSKASERAVEDDLPEVIDLLRLAVGSGLTASLAVATVASRAPGPVGGAFRSALRHATAGHRLGDALDEEAATLVAERQAMAPLLAALADATRDGSPLEATLERLASEARGARRRRAEERARRVPVLLLLPLVCCTLPAVGLLTVVPVAAGAIRSLGS